MLRKRWVVIGCTWSSFTPLFFQKMKLVVDQLWALVGSEALRMLCSHGLIKGWEIVEWNTSDSLLLPSSHLFLLSHGPSCNFSTAVLKPANNSWEMAQHCGWLLQSHNNWQSLTNYSPQHIVCVCVFVCVRDLAGGKDRQGKAGSLVYPHLHLIIYLSDSLYTAKYQLLKAQLWKISAWWCHKGL